MSIGETLTEARRRTGLTIDQVSRQTRVRDVIIRGIERDDFSACGGDFYARGHIRSIAHAVGVDPEPLIREYDGTVRSTQPVTVAELFRPATPVRMHEPGRHHWGAVLGLALVIGIGFGSYYFITSGRHAGASPTAALKTSGVAHSNSRGAAPRPSATPAHTPAQATPTPAAQTYAHQVVIHLRAVEDCWVEFTTPGGGFLSQAYVVGGTSKTWTFRRAVDMRLGNPGGIRLTVDGKNPLPPGTMNPVTLSLGLGGAVTG